MLTRIAVAVVGVLFVASSPAAAQSPPTTPATIDVTCYGYDGATTRAYNCIPVAHQQHLLATFVPPVGSTCNGGKIAEFPPGRIVFQIRCQKTGGTDPPTPPPTEDHDYEIASVRRYASSIRVADWLYFTWRARVACKPIRGNGSVPAGGVLHDVQRNLVQPVGWRAGRGNEHPEFVWS